jgi:hypothetical protein
MPRRRWIIVAGLAVIFGIGCRLAQFLSNQSFGAMKQTSC